MRIALDAMGGDYGCAEAVAGGLKAAAECGIDVVLVGRQEEVQRHLAKHDLSAEKSGSRKGSIEVVDAPQVVEMGDRPTAVRGKPASSLSVGMELVRDGRCAAFVSAGNSGAVVAAALFILGRIEGIERPAFGGLIPTLPRGRHVVPGKALLLDMGANVDCKPHHLLQFAQMGSVYMERVFAVPRPRIALLSNGEEPGKGSQNVRSAFFLLKESGLNFVGNIEGCDLLKGLADVIVTDGFTGNVVLKLGEGLSETLFYLIKESLEGHPGYKVLAFFLSPVLKGVAKKVDYTEHGGAPLLGVNGTVIIAHGASKAKAIRNAVVVAKQAAESGMVEAIRQGIGTPRPSGKEPLSAHQG